MFEPESRMAEEALITTSTQDFLDACGKYPLDGGEITTVSCS
jgi:hypothetical protein